MTHAHLLALSLPAGSDEKTLIAQNENKGFGYRTFSVPQAPSLSVWNNFLLTSHTAVLSHSSELLRPFSLLLPTLSYRLTLSQALDDVCYLIVFIQ